MQGEAKNFFHREETECVAAGQRGCHFRHGCGYSARFWGSIFALFVVVVCAMNSPARAKNLLDDAVQQVINRRADVGGSFSRSADGVWRLMPSTKGGGFGDFRLICEPRAALPSGTKLVFECEMRAVGTDETPAAGQAGILLDVTPKCPPQECSNPCSATFCSPGRSGKNF